MVDPAIVGEDGWTSQYGCHTRTFGHFTVRVSPYDEPAVPGFIVQVERVTLKRLSPDVEDGKRRAVATLRQMLSQALSELPTEANRPVRMDADDVSVEAIETAVCDQCGERPVTHRVMLNMRATGSMSAVEEMCQPCAEDCAQSLKASLPANAADETGGDR